MNTSTTRPNRRAFLASGAALAGVFAVGAAVRWVGAAGATTIVGKPGKVTIDRFSDDGKNLGPETVDKVVKTEEEWRTLLANAPSAGSVTAFMVTRQEGTEWAGTGPNSHNFAPGLYRCICCDNALYTNETKFDSGTGWPSFYAPISEGERALRRRAAGRIQGLVRALRCPSRARFRRWSEADGPALLHGRRGDALHRLADDLR